MTTDVLVTHFTVFKVIALSFLSQKDKTKNTTNKPLNFTKFYLNKIWPVDRHQVSIAHVHYIIVISLPNSAIRVLILNRKFVNATNLNAQICTALP